MTVFTEHLVESNRALWAAMAGHPFVLGLADGTLPDGALQAWVQQDRIFVVEERRVVAALRAHGTCRRGSTACSPTSTAAWCWRRTPSPRPPPTRGLRSRSSPGRSAWAIPPIFVAPPTTASWKYRPVRGRARLPGHLDGRGRSQPGRLGLPRLDPGIGAGGVPVSSLPSAGASTKSPGRHRPPDRPPGRHLHRRRPVRAGLLGDVLERPGMAGLSQRLSHARAGEPGTPARPSHRARDRHRRPGPRTVPRPGWSVICSCSTTCGCSP